DVCSSDLSCGLRPGMRRKHQYSSESTMSNFDSYRVGTALLRISLGAMFIAHSIVLKYFTYTLAGTADYFTSIGLPAFLAYVVFAAEAIGGVLLVQIGRASWRERA